MNQLEIRSIVGKTAARDALLLGAFLLVRFAIEVSMLQYPWISIFYVVMSVALPFYAYYMAKKLHAQSSEGYIGFFNFYNYTFFLFVFASFILTLGQYIFYQYLSPLYITNMFQAVAQNIDLLLSRFPAFESYKDILTQSPVPSALNMATQSLLNGFYLGVFIGLINGLIYRLNYKNKHH